MSAQPPPQTLLLGCRPIRVLVVTSTQTGGMPQSHRDLAIALQRCAGKGGLEVWHLNALHQTLTLSRVDDLGQDCVVHRHQLPQAVAPTTHRDPAYDAVVRTWLTEYRFSVLQVHHLAWHSLGLLSLAKEAGARVVVTFHDYYHLCPTVKLVDADGHYCAGACSAGATDCAPEPMWPGFAFPRLRGAWVQEWRQMAEQALAAADAYTAPHDSVRQVVLTHLDLPADKPFEVMAHGRDFAQVQWLGQLPKRGQVLNILVPGHLIAAKGLDVVRRLAQRDRGEKLQFHVLGPVQAPLEMPGVTVHGEYRSEEFSTWVRRISPHVGAVFSIWNETWCHTLTEMWACGLPVMAFDFPTVGSRIRESGAGWVWPVEAAAEGEAAVADLHARILRLDFMEVSRKAARAAAWMPKLLQQCTKRMAQKYLALYRRCGVEVADEELGVDVDPNN